MCSVLIVVLSASVLLSLVPALHIIKETGILIVDGSRDCEVAFDVYGDSMYPRFKHGDLVLCISAKNKPIQFGEAYLVIANGNPAIRIIKNQTKEGSYKLSTDNPRYEDYETNIKDINDLYMVKGVIRRESF